MESIFNNKLPEEQYLGSDVVKLARTFLGKELNTFFSGIHTSGKIVEVEAYCGATDSACHAFPDKLTARTQTMYMMGGIAYVYLVYGMHHLFNIVTNIAGRADAVLVRAVEPKFGVNTMMQRRSVYRNTRDLTGGPARLTEALGITTKDDQASLLGDKIWISNAESIADRNIIATRRIGIDYAGEDAFLPWRFYIKGNKYVSK